MKRYILIACLCVPGWGQNVPEVAKPAAPVAGANTADTATADPLVSARALLKKSKFADAATAYKALVEKDPSSAEAQAGLVRSLLRSRQVDEADLAGKRALAVVPGSALVQAAVGDVAFRKGAFAEAEAAYRAAMRADANSARAWFGIGRIMNMVSMRKQGAGAIAKAHELDPEDEQIYETWIETLPRAQQLQAMKKYVGDHPSGRQAEEIKLLTAIAEKKPWALTTGIKASEVKMVMVGNKEAYTTDVSSSISSNGPIHIGKGYGLQVKFNGRVSADILLDTGADGLVIGSKLAEKVGVVKIADSYFGGIGDKGPVAGYLGWVDKIKIGDVEFRDCIVEVSSRNNVVEESGLIGADIFDKFLITLDFRERKMLLAPLPKGPNASEDDEAPQDRYIAPEMQSFTKAYILGDHLFVPVIVNDKATGNFMLDTGADSNTISPKLASQVTKTSDDKEYVMKGVSGKVDNVLTGRKAILQIAKMRIESHDLPVFSLDSTSNSFGTEVAGFIGILTLSQMKMTIDYRDGLVNLQVYEFKKAQE
jgi:tetratricopeptide (TPR) repeat protein